MDNRAAIYLSSDTEDECKKDKLVMRSGCKANIKQRRISMHDTDSEDNSIKSSGSDSVCYIETTNPDNIFKSARLESKRTAVSMSNKKHKQDHSLHKGFASPIGVTSHGSTKVSARGSIPTRTTLDFSCASYVKHEAETPGTSLTKHEQYLNSFRSFTKELKEEGKNVVGALSYAKNLQRAIVHFEEYPYDWKELGESRWFDPEFNAKVESIHANVRCVGQATVLLFAWLARTENEHITDYRFKYGTNEGMVFSCTFHDFKKYYNKNNPVLW